MKISTLGDFRFWVSELLAGGGGFDSLPAGGGGVLRPPATDDADEFGSISTGAALELPMALKTSQMK